MDFKKVRRKVGGAKRYLGRRLVRKLSLDDEKRVQAGGLKHLPYSMPLFTVPSAASVPVERRYLFLYFLCFVCDVLHMFSSICCLGPWLEASKYFLVFIATPPTNIPRFFHPVRCKLNFILLLDCMKASFYLYAARNRTEVVVSLCCGENADTIMCVFMYV